MKALHRFLETYIQVTQRRGIFSLGRVRLGWLSIEEKQPKQPRMNVARVPDKKVAATVHKSKKFHEYDKRVKRLAAEN